MPVPPFSHIGSRIIFVCLLWILKPYSAHIQEEFPFNGQEGWGMIKASIMASHIIYVHIVYTHKLYLMLFQAEKSVAMQIAAEIPLLIWKLLYSPAHHLQLLQPLDLLLKLLPSLLMRLDQALYLNHRPTSKKKEEQKWVKEYTTEENKNRASGSNDSKCIFSSMQLKLTLKSALIFLLKVTCTRQQGVVLHRTQSLLRVCTQKILYSSSIYFTGTLDWLSWVRYGALQSKMVFVSMQHIPVVLWHRISLHQLHGWSILARCFPLPYEGRSEELNPKHLLLKRKKVK